MSHGFSKEFINFLNQPESYPHNPDRVDHIQTHISHVFITPPYVYKFKKHVNFEFLDFSTLDKRKYYCERELKLNQRLCGDAYIDVVPVFKSGNSWTFDASGHEEPFEYAVRMKQLSKDDFLIEYAKNGKLENHHLDRVVSRLVPFYKKQTPDESITQWGRPDRIKINTDENFEQTAPFIDDTIDESVYATIRSFTNRYLKLHKSLFEKRLGENRIVDGHGDLHLEHIHITNERVCIYDCIEFNDRFRYQDVASDIAFLAMDLDFNGYKNESSYFVNQMSENLDDPDLLRLIDYYKCYRAYVRGKVKSMESGEEEVGASGQRRASLLASRYFSLALKYALTGSTPAVLVFMGRIASGKSTLAEELAGKLQIERFSSDIVRKKMAGLSVAERTPPEKRKEIYKNSMTARTYETLFKKAAHEIRKGKSVVLDATFGDRDARSNLLSTLQAVEANMFFIEVQAPEEIRKNRLAMRSNQEHVTSDARLEDFEMLNQKYEPLSDAELIDPLHINSDQPLKNGLHELFSKLSDKQHFRKDNCN